MVRVQVAANALVFPDAAKRTILELADNGVVTNLYIADALQYRVHANEVHRWTPQVIVFCAYILSVGRNDYDALRSILIAPCITTLLKYLNGCSLDQTST